MITLKIFFTFASLVKSFDFPTDRTFMCSIDIKSLFTSVPLQETIDICADFLYGTSGHILDIPLSRDHFVSLMKWATSSVEFSFNDTMYKQHDEIAMGSPLGPTLANIFVGFWEARLFNSIVSPLAYFCYVDDTFAIFRDKKESVSFLSHLNSLHPALQFTHEEETNDCLSFLDVLVERNGPTFLCSVYRKPTFSGLYSRWDSFSPTRRKINLVKTLTDRAMRICSESRLQEELAKLKNIFLQNGYPERVIERTISDKLASGDRPPEMGPKRCPVFIRLPWVGAPSVCFEKRIRVATSKCFPQANPRVIFTTRAMLPFASKDVLPTLSASNVIYHFVCRCEADYVGRTSLRVTERIKQHVPASFLKKLSDPTPAANNPLQVTNKSLSAIAQHLLDSPDCVLSFAHDRFSILAKARSSFHLQILEALYIRKLSPVLCKQKELIYSLKL